MPQILKLALIQHALRADPDFDPGRNLDACIDACRRAAASGCRLVLLQELHNGPYFCQQETVERFDLAEPVPGPTTRRLGAVAAELGIVIVGSLFERRGPGLYHNTAVVLDADGRLCGTYRKMHIPDDPGFYEKFYFTPGDLGFEPVDTAVGRLGVLVCWDQWFPEAARLMALAGAELLLYPTAIGWDPQDAADEQQRQLDAWMTVQRGHAIANGLPLAACNRVGFEAAAAGASEGAAAAGAEAAAASDGILFWGNSFVCGPQGELLAHGPSDQEAMLLAEIDLGRSEQVRRIWPFLRDRRIDAYADLSRRWRDRQPPGPD
ncbi:carbon-nitrogen hydrolase [Thiohalocapsa marina]|uniref:Carbon-nitrogen hydrolase n=1 Tax=Thiohalocapsa marina TaxID=424902 RepID=A0A5M8FDE4_9GAMM|nr:carbon-nitrogen hydrolase [Thiohalocapsa marina]KAA6182898.1 carbon-nitrogen hydrolase [Thiohalocapsa marina]